MEACHFDGNPANNRLENLRWDTRTNNHADKRAHGTLMAGERHYRAKLTEQQVRELRAAWVPNVVTKKMLASRYGICVGQVKQIIAGDRKSVV